MWCAGWDGASVCIWTQSAIAEQLDYTTGEVKGYATIQSIGVEWHFKGDENHYGPRPQIKKAAPTSKAASTAK